jgi:hypothetical protein
MVSGYKLMEKASFFVFCFEKNSSNWTPVGMKAVASKLAMCRISQG